MATYRGFGGGPDVSMMAASVGFDSGISPSGDLDMGLLDGLSGDLSHSFGLTSRTLLLLPTPHPDALHTPPLQYTLLQYTLLHTVCERSSWRAPFDASVSRLTRVRR